MKRKIESEGTIAEQVRHAVPMHSAIHARVIYAAWRLREIKHYDGDAEASFNDLAQIIAGICIQASSITPAVHHDLEQLPSGLSARPSSESEHSGHIMPARADRYNFVIPASVDAAFRKVARAHGLTWSQAFAFACAWIIPADVQDQLPNFLMEHRERW
jgi:hypothetical protein